jgi:prepilin-type N-terminal cleavage/methylation domain-containing protein
MSKKKGYTLIELITVLALFSILLLISIPNLSFLHKYREYNEVKQFEKDIKYARSSALTKNAPVVTFFDITNNGYKIIQHNKVIKEYKFQQGVNIKSINTSSGYLTSGGSSIEFKTTGAPSSAATIEFDTRYHGKYNITINVATGRINIKTIR